MAEEKQGCSGASECSRESCEGCPSASGQQKTDLREAANPNSHISHVIGVVSGKGGVGKSFVTSSLAGIMRRAGYSVGILDADITGPSIPKMFGVHGPAVGNDEGSFPIEAADGTKIMSVNLLLQDEAAPVVWRGPVIAGAVKQFWTDVVSGRKCGLSVRGHASGNRRRAADRVPDPAGGRRHRRHLARRSWCPMIVTKACQHGCA